MKHRTKWLACAIVLSGCGAQAMSSASQETASQATGTQATVAPPSAPAAATAATDSVDRSGLPDLAVMSTDGHVVVIRDGVMGKPVVGRVAADHQTLITTSFANGTTSLAWTGLGDGREHSRLELDGDLTAVATDLSGKIVAMTRANPASAGGTEIVIVTHKGEAFRKGYASELLPEGFSDADSQGKLPASLFVIEYLDPPSNDTAAPRRYRIRVLDTSTGDLALPFNLRNKGETVDESMLGFSRTHVTSRRNGLLFTLYRGLGSDEANYAFVHTLGFVNGVWCLDLPSELSLGQLPGAVVLVDGEKRLLVASANGYVTEFVINDITDPGRQPVPTRTVKVWSANPNGGAPSLSFADGQILVGQDDALRLINSATLATTTTLHWDMRIEAVALLAGGDALAAGTGRISRISPAGELTGEDYLPGDFGPVAQIVIVGNG